MRQTFIHGNEDMQWLFSTHCKHVSEQIKSKCKSAIIHGNEDCPEKVEIHWEEFPLANSMPAVTLTQNQETGDLE